MVNFVINLLQLIGYPVVFISQSLEGMGLPFPSEATLVAIAVYAGITGNLNLILIIILSTLGAFTGDNIGYLIGRHKGYDFLISYGHRFHISKERIMNVREYFDKHGPITVFIGRFFAILRIFSPLLAGISHMKYIKFALFNFAACFLWASLYSSLGYFLGKNIVLLDKVLKDISIGIYIVVGLLILILIFVYYQKKKTK